MENLAYEAICNITIPLSKDEKELYGEGLFNRLKEWLSIEKGGAMVNEMTLSVAH